MATTSTKPVVPDRHAFQQALREYNRNISEIANSIDFIIGRKSTAGTLNILKQSRQKPHEKREQLKREADQMKNEIDVIKRRLAEKDTLLVGIENDLVYRDENRLTVRLKELECAYSQTNFTSSRTEKALIKEIDKLKRNRMKLVKYNTLLEEKRIIQLQLREMIEKRSNLLKSIREITNQLHNIDQQIRQNKRDFLQLKNDLRELYTKKKELVDSYNKQRKEYIDWSNSNCTDIRCSLDHSYPATYPSTRRNQTFVSCIDEETLEPFYEQKMACKRLIEYLKSLQSQMSAAAAAEYSSSGCSFADKAHKQMTADESDDSAEEYPAGISALKMQTSLPARLTDERELEKEPPFVSVLKRKINKKSSKKPCQKICHPVQMLCFFKETEIPIPYTYREIEQTLEKVHALLKLYQEQTNTIVWEESDYRQLPSFSESEHTADSAWNGSTDMSERGSNHGLVRASSSVDFTKPVQEAELPLTNICNQVMENLACMSTSDEGFASKNSTH